MRNEQFSCVIDRVVGIVPLSMHTNTKGVYFFAELLSPDPRMRSGCSCRPIVGSGSYNKSANVVLSNEDKGE